MKPFIVVGCSLLVSCSAGTDLPAHVEGLVYDEDVECDGTDCTAEAETFDASAVVGEDASRFAPDGVYVYAWFWRDDHRFVEIEIDAPDPELAIPDPIVEYREWDGDERVFESEVATGDVTVDFRGEDGEVAGRFSLLLEAGDDRREIHEGRFTTVPPPPGAIAGGSGGGGGGGTSTGHEPVGNGDDYRDHVSGEAYVESGCTCVAADDPYDDGSGGCDDGSSDYDSSGYDSGGGGCDGGCEGDTAPSDEGGGGCSGETGGGGCDCEGDVAASDAPPVSRPSTLRRIWSQTFPFAMVGAGLVYWRRRARAAIRRLAAPRPSGPPSSAPGDPP